VEETPSEPKSLRGGDEVEDEDEEEGEITPLPHSLPPKDLPSPGDVFSQQAGISVGARQPKCPQTGTGALSDPSPHSSLALVSSDLQGIYFTLAVME
jgi:hypothetical protein